MPGIKSFIFTIKSIESMESSSRSSESFEQRAGPHAEQRDAGGQAEAEHRVADEVGGRRAQDELVDEPADGDQEGRRE